MAQRTPGKNIFGQLFATRIRGVVIPFTQRVENVDVEGTPVASYGNAATEIMPVDANSATVKAFDISALRATLLAQVFSYTAQISFELPPTLTSMSIVYNASAGAGSDTAAGSGYATGSPFNLSIPASSRSSGSASIIPDLIPVITTPQAIDVSVKVYEIHMDNGFTLAQLLARLTALMGAPVLAWPVFHPKPLYFSLHGQTASLSANASVHKSLYISTDSTSNSAVVEQGSSKENSVTIRSKEFSPTLHAAIVLSGQSPSTTQTATVTATADAGWTGTGVFPSGASTSHPTDITLTASVFPTTIPATVPTTTPTTGLYLKTHTQQVDDEPGLIAVVATIIDMSIFA